MPDHVLEPGKVGIVRWGRAVLPAHIVQQLVLPPVGQIEGRVCQDEVGLQLGVGVVEEGIGAELAQVSLNPPDGQVHLGHLPGGGVGVLAKDGNPVDVAPVIFNEFGGLDEHAAAAAAGVIDPAIKGLQDLHQGAHHAGGGIEFTGQLALLLGESGQAVFIGAAQNVLAVALLHHLNIGEQVHHISQAALVQLRPGKVLGQDVLEALVLRFNAAHGLINDGADLRGVGRCSNHAPTGIFRDKEDVFCQVFVLVLLEAVALFHQFLVLGLKTIGDVF